MNRLLSIIFLCLLSGEINCQVIRAADSANIGQIKFIDSDLSGSSENAKFNAVTGDIIEGRGNIILDNVFYSAPEFLYRDDDKVLLSSLAFPRTENNLFENTRAIQNNFHNIYLWSKPTALQKIFYNVNMSGAFLLAGYHIWKYYIKK